MSGHGHEGDTGHAGVHGHHEAHTQPGADDHASVAHGAHEVPPGQATRDVHAAHDTHAGHSVEMFRRKFWLSLALTIPTLIWGEMLPHLLRYTPPRIPGARWIPVVFGVAVFFYGGWVFIRGAERELRDRRPGMMTLIALAISVAFVFSLAVTAGISGMPLWSELSTLVTIMLLGHWMEMRSISQAQGALQELAKLLPNVATRVVGDRMEDVPLGELRQGDLVLVRAASRIPADGTVREGHSAVNESMITGESALVSKQPGDAVIGGTVNGDGSLRVLVTQTGERTALAGIMRLVAQAQTSRSRAQALADRAAFLLTLAAIASAGVTAVAWLLIGATPEYLIERVVTVLVIACPHALGLAIPLVIAISTTLGARSGMLVRDRRGLENARTVTAVVFDKTGTLTLGEHRVVAIETDGSLTQEEVLRLASAVEQGSEHPIARAIVRSAEARAVRPAHARDFVAIPGRGVQATVEGRHLVVGGPNLLAHQGIEPPPALRAFVDTAARRGQGVIYLIEDAHILAAIAVADAVRPESAEAVRRLHAEGIEVAMLTGDTQAVASAVAQELGIDAVLAQVLPGEKAAKIRELQARGQRVAMVGDGVNDAPALLTADVGVAIGAGTDVAVEAGDVVLVRNDPRDVPRIIALSRAAYRKMIQNLWWAAGYNIIAIPLAAGVLERWGIVLSPAVGAVLMSLSTVIVAINAQLLRRIAL